MNFRRILFATDGSDTALRAATELARMSGRDNETSVTVIAAVPQTDAAPIDGEGVLSNVRIHPEAGAHSAADHALRKTEAVFLKWGIPYSGLVVGGDCACTAIANAARRDLCDLIVLSGEENADVADGQPSAEKLAEEVRRRASVPVLLIPGRAG